MSIDPLGLTLLLLARNAIGKRFGCEARPLLPHPDLARPSATFVTLTQDGALRGCVGSLSAQRPLAADVSENAVASAFHDSRFSPLGADELPRTRIEVSLLDTPRTLTFNCEAAALSQLRPGIDGVILTYGTHRATFLPQVWEQLPDPQSFIEALKTKAGLPAHFWDESIELARYGVQKWKET